MNAARRCTLPTVYRTLRPHAPLNALGTNRLLPLDDGEDDNGHSQLARLHPQSALQVAAPPPLCVFHELVATNGAFLRHVSAVDASWLARYATPAISRRALLVACGRDVPVEVGEQESVHQDGRGEEKKTTKHERDGVTADTVAAARARFLARKRQR
jgi:hypothetical protein